MGGREIMILFQFPGMIGLLDTDMVARHQIIPFEWLELGKYIYDHEAKSFALDRARDH